MRLDDGALTLVRYSEIPALIGASQASVGKNFANDESLGFGSASATGRTSVQAVFAQVETCSDWMAEGLVVDIGGG